MELLICPELGNRDFQVRLWATLEEAPHRVIRRTPVLSWIKYSRVLESARVLDDSTLGTIDACVGRGESVCLNLQTGFEQFAGIAFELVQKRPKAHHYIELGAVPKHATRASEDRLLKFGT